MTEVRLTAVVSGRVQGVGFRYWVRRRADALRLTGTATNQPNGDVEVVAEGSRENAERLLELLRDGAAPGFVGRVTAEWTDAMGEYPDFRER